MFIDENLKNVEDDQVQAYSQALFSLYNWLKEALDLRIHDVKTRRKKKVTQRAEREEAEENEKARLEKKQAYVDQKEEEYEDKIQADKDARDKLRQEAGIEEGDGDQSDPPEPFAKEEAEKDFDEETPPITIPPEVIDDIDNDYNFEDEEEDDGE